MNRPLQELVNLCVYFDSTISTHMCEINFKGNLEPYDIVSVESLIGDLLACTVENIEGVSDDELAMLWNPWAGKIVVAPSAPFAELNEVAKRVIESVEDTPEESAHFLSCINDFLCDLSEKKIPLSTNSFDSFLLSSGLYAPPCTLFVPKRSDCGKLLEAYSFCARPHLSPLAIMELKDYSKCAFCFECDSFSEVIISLLRYISITGCTLVKCERCNRWFIPNKKRDEKYCSRIYGEKTCKELATAEKRKIRLQASPLQKKYNSVNTNLASKVKRAPEGQTKKHLQDELYKFRNEWHEKKKELDEPALLDWLNKPRG